MSRVARIVVPGFPHHITQRGNRGAAVFESDEDRESYLGLLLGYMEKRKASLWAYCLMPNHIHLILVPERAESLGEILRDTHTVYSRRFNERSDSTGHVWQGRYYSSPLDEKYLWAAVRYVERNPVRTGLVDHAEDYPWSSAAAHCGLKSDPLLTDEFPPRDVIADWSDWLLTEDEEATATIRKKTHTGWPCGEAAFVERLENVVGRSLRPRKRGRKPRSEIRAPESPKR